jgi:hypothetical protein
MECRLVGASALGVVVEVSRHSVARVQEEVIGRWC